MDLHHVEHPRAVDLMTHKVIMLPSRALFKDLIRTMHDKRVSAVIIHDEGNPNYYIISHSVVIDFMNDDIDIKAWANIYEVPLYRLMRGPIKILDKETPIEDVIRFMAEHGYKRVLIGNKEKPEGIISVRDILSWNNKYFKESKPLVVLVMDNDSSIIIAKYIFKENLGLLLDQDKIDDNLIELYGGAIASFSAITDEILNHSGDILVFQKENFTILLEPRENITGILVTDNNSIALRRRLHDFTNRFTVKFSEILDNPNYKKFAKKEYNIKDLAQIFIEKKDSYIY